MTRSIPPNPSLEFDRKQAKSLLDAARHGDPSALGLFREHHPRFRDAIDPNELALHDAQLVIAREYGFSSWPRWKQFVETRRLDLAGRAVELIKAACDADMRKATMLLSAEPELARFDFYTACTCGEVALVEQQLMRDPDLAKRKGGPLDREPILYACFSRFLRSDPPRASGIVRIVRLLLDRGADPNAFFFMDLSRKQWQQTPLYGAAGIANNAELTRMLLDAGADVNDRDNEILYHASEFKDTTCARLVLEAKPDPEHVSYDLSRALDFDNPPMVELFLQHGADPNFGINRHQKRTHLHKAVMNGRSVGTVRALLDAGAEVNARDASGFTPLRYAERFGFDELAELLRSRGADESAITDEDRAMGAILRGKSREASIRPDPELLCRAAQENDVAAIHRLLDAGAAIDAPSSGESLPPLHWAAWRGHADAVKALVERGASLTIVNCYGANALGTAIHGSANCHDPEGGSTMKLAEEITHGDYPSIVETLLCAGSPLPQLVQEGSDAVQEVLRRYGVPDGTED